MYQLLSIVELACILSFVSMAAVLTFRFAGFPDLSVDGVFALGAVMFAKLTSIGWNVPLALLGAVCAGIAIGALTATIATKLKVNPLLASVLVLTILYSLNLRILGVANLPVYGVLSSAFAQAGVRVWLFLSTAVVVWCACFVFFKTEIGAGLRATGSSPEFLSAIGRNVSLFRLVLVAMAGGAVAASGALLSLKFGFADVSMGAGIVIIGIAALIIGERFCGRDDLLGQLLAAPIGILVYELVVGAALSIGISPVDVKLSTGVLVIILLGISQDERQKLLG